MTDNKQGEILIIDGVAIILGARQKLRDDTASLKACPTSLKTTNHIVSTMPGVSTFASQYYDMLQAAINHLLTW